MTSNYTPTNEVTCSRSSIAAGIGILIRSFLPIVLPFVPAFVKGWGLHKEHEDRYVLLQGELELVVYDVQTRFQDQR